MSISKMQGTSAYITKLKLGKNDKYRSKAKCVYYSNAEQCCKCYSSGYYDKECSYVKRCTYYAEGTKKVLGKRKAKKMEKEIDEWVDAWENAKRKKELSKKYYKNKKTKGKNSALKISGNQDKKVAIQRSKIKKRDKIKEGDIVKLTKVSSGETVRYLAYNKVSDCKKTIIPNLCMSKKIGDQFVFNDETYIIISAER